MADTGLPTPPDGGFWRVRQKMKSYYVDLATFDLTTGDIEVVLMHTRTKSVRKHWWLSAKDVVTEEVYPHTRPVTVKGRNPIAVANAARAVMRKYKEWQTEQSLLGDYPPKSL